VKISRSRSSGIEVPAGSVTSAPPATSARCLISLRIASKRPARRKTSMALWRAVDTSQARGLPGQPSRGQRSSAAANASGTASSATWKSPISRMTVASTRPNSSR